MALSTVFSNGNIVSIFKYVSSELEILGYPEISYDEQNEKQVLVKLINITWALISDMKNLLLKNNEQTVELTKLKTQIISHDHEKYCFEKLLNKERESFSKLNESLILMLSQKNNLDKELKKNKLELKNMKKNLNTLELQYGNEILRKQNAIVNLKEKLARFVDVGNCDFEENLTISQISSVTGKNPKLNKYFALLSNNIQMLILENANIRNLIIKILVQICNKCGSKCTIDENELIPYLLNLPELGFIEKIEEKLSNILNCIKS